MPFLRVILMTVLVLVLMPGWVLAHGVSYQVEADPKPAISFAYENGEPLAQANFEIISPTAPKPFLTGQTDSLGRVEFHPDSPGKWVIKVFTEDGHGSVAVVGVGEDLSFGQSTRQGPNRWKANLMGLFAVLGVFAIGGVMARWNPKTE